MSIFRGTITVLAIIIQSLQNKYTTKEDLNNAAEVLDGQAKVLREIANGMEDGETIAKL